MLTLPATALATIEPQFLPTRRMTLMDSDSTADLDMLSELNQDYIASVQNSDVSRFEELLAPEFYCSNPDGTLLDRAAFLHQVGRGVTITGLTASDVKLRLYGDVAIIHGATSYRSANGQEGRGRYTDVWVRSAGQWRAVSAHVTRCD
jgi:ketosteroid isomerase-like protein